MEEQGKPENEIDDPINTELSEALDEMSMVRIGLYRGYVSKTGFHGKEFTDEDVISLTYYKRCSSQIEQDVPQGFSNRGMGFIDIPNVTDLGRLVHEYERLLKLNKVVYNRLLWKEIDDNENGLLVTHHYGVMTWPSIKSRELTSILRQLKQDCIQS